MGYMTEHDDAATLGSITPTSSSVGMFVKPKTKSMSSHGSLMPKGNADGERVVSTSSHPIIGESAAMFTDMTDYNNIDSEKKATIRIPPGEIPFSAKCFKEYL